MRCILLNTVSMMCSILYLRVHCSWKHVKTLASSEYSFLWNTQVGQGDRNKDVKGF